MGLDAFVEISYNQQKAIDSGFCSA